jgi:M6 family metalloprotease-like protein
MKKRNYFVIGTTLLVTLVTLTSCQNVFFSFNPYKYDVEPVEHQKIADNGTYYRPDSFNKSYQDDVFRSYPVESRKTYNLPYKGDVNLLVLPVDFTDYTANELDGKNGKNAHAVIENAFFGHEGATQWESVASYYDKVSYGQLKIRGEVAPWYTLPEEFSVEGIKDQLKLNNDRQAMAVKIMRQAVKNFKDQFPEKVSDYDLDDNGVIDAVYLVYSYNYETNANGNDGFFWAYTTFDNIRSHDVSSEGPAPYANAFTWSSFAFMNINNSLFRNKPDTHTYIHETGHLLGLVDYYNTNYLGKNNPLGGFDMMDFAVGDHTAFTKMLFEWTYPYVVTGPGEIKIAPFNKSGDTILVSPNWNGNALDEYLLIEYYAPNGINRLDTFANSIYNLPTSYGVKVYHVDARTVYVDTAVRPNPFFYSDTVIKTPTMFEDLAHTNSDGAGNSGYFKDISLYQLLERSGNNTFVDGERATNDTLFTKGDIFGIDVYNDFTFHSKGELPFNFEITSMTKDYVVINFTARN